MAQKIKIVLSDLHLSVKPKNSKAQVIDQVLPHFLREIEQESERTQQEVELILNGDTFDFLEVPGVDEYDPAHTYEAEFFRDSSEQAALKQLKIIADSHAAVFETLADFLQVKVPQRRMVIVKGDHDVQLYWPAIKNRVRELLKASGERASLLVFAGEFLNRRQVYIEHGHQQAEKINRYSDFIDPRQPEKQVMLHYPPASAFVVNLLSEQTTWPAWLVSEMKPTTTLIWYALAWDFPLALRLLFTYFNQPPQLAHDPFWQNLADSSQHPQLTRRYAQDPRFRQELHYHLLHYLHLTTPLLHHDVVSNVVNLMPTNPLLIGQAEQLHQRFLLHRAAQELIKKDKAKVVIFGHTHAPSQELFESGYIYINTGSWTPDLSQLPFDALEAIFKGQTSNIDVPIRFPYARVDYDNSDNVVAAQLLYYTPAPTQALTLATPTDLTTPTAKNNWLAGLFSLLT